MASSQAGTFAGIGTISNDPIMNLINLIGGIWNTVDARVRRRMLAIR